MELSLIHEHAAHDFETRGHREISFARLIDNDVPAREQCLSNNHYFSIAVLQVISIQEPIWSMLLLDILIDVRK